MRNDIRSEAAIWAEGTRFSTDDIVKAYRSYVAECEEKGTEADDIQTFCQRDLEIPNEDATEHLNNLHMWTVRTDAGMSEIEAADIDAAAVAWAKGDSKEAAEAVTDLTSLIDYIQSIPGAWLWIESDTAPDGDRVYAGWENMPS